LALLLEGRDVEKRLIPINALIGLTTPGGLERPVLAEAGFHTAGLEIGAVSPVGGKVTIDVVLANDSTGHLLACESKSGNNISVPQAERYAALDGPTVVQAALVTLRERVDPHTEAVYACLGEHVERILLGLRSADLALPVVAVHPKMITLENAAHASEVLQTAFAEPVSLDALPPRVVGFDHESPIEVIEPHARAVLVACLTRRVPQITITMITEQATPHYALYSRGAQSQLRRKVAEAVRRIAQNDSETFEYHGATANRDGWVRFLRTPEDNDPRGRTQSYQALARRGRAGRPVSTRIPGEGQLDLLQELDQADDVAEDAEAEGEGTS
jgi:hypothetical protein